MYCRHVLPEKFYLEPRDREGGLLSQQYLEIDRHSNAIRLGGLELFLMRCTYNIFRQYSVPDPVNRIRNPFCAWYSWHNSASVRYVNMYYFLQFSLISGPALVVIKRSKQVGTVNGHLIYTITETDVIPYKKTTLHLTQKQVCQNFNQI